MAIVTITHAGLNGDVSPIWLGDLYTSLQYGKPVTVARAPAQFNAMPGLLALAGSGQVAISITPTTEELTSGARGLFTPIFPPLVPGITKELVNGALTPLFQIDVSKTTHPGELPDNSFGCKLFFAVECTDRTEVQIREGDVNAAVAFKAPATFNTAQAVSATNALTAGTLTVTFSWTTVGTIATLNVTATSSLTPTDFEIHYFLSHATHDVVTYP